MVIQKCCIGTSEVSKLMCSTRFMGDGCFNNTVDKTFYCHKHVSVCVLLDHMGLHRSTKLHENCYLVHNKHDSVP